MRRPRPPRGWCAIGKTYFQCAITFVNMRTELLGETMCIGHTSALRHTTIRVHVCVYAHTDIKIRIWGAFERYQSSLNLFCYLYAYNCDRQTDMTKLIVAFRVRLWVAQYSKPRNSLTAWLTVLRAVSGPWRGNGGWNCITGSGKGKPIIAPKRKWKTDRQTAGQQMLFISNCFTLQIASELNARVCRREQTFSQQDKVFMDYFLNVNLYLRN
jgi:hypothetical protein